MGWLDSIKGLGIFVPLCFCGLGGLTDMFDCSSGWLVDIMLAFCYFYCLILTENKIRREQKTRYKLCMMYTYTRHKIILHPWRIRSDQVIICAMLPA